MKSIINKTVTENLNDVNLTPLIDVSLVLVVILLLATPLAFEAAINVNRSKASGQTAEEKTESTRIELSIVSDDSVKVNRRLVAREGLQDVLRPLLAKSTSQQVVIACADLVSHGAFVDVLDQTKLSGASQIAVRER